MATLLLIDDDEDLSETLADLFAMLEHFVDIANDGASALAFLRTKSYDLILLDWQLPDMTGLEICKQYRDEGGKTPILMLSGMRDADSKQAGTAAGATSFLAKPFTMDKLIDRVQSLLSGVSAE